MSMIRLTVEETNLLSIYNEGGKAQLAERTLSKVDSLTDEEYAELSLHAADGA